MRPIDADTLKILLDTFATVMGFGGIYDRGQVKECIDAAPTIDGWISVKDRLPEEKINPNTRNFEEVLCATEFGDVRVYGFGTRIGQDEPHFWHGFQIMDQYVIHWQYKPEMPKEE